MPRPKKVAVPVPGPKSRGTKRLTTLDGITGAACRRLLEKAGFARSSPTMYDPIRHDIKSLTRALIEKAKILADHRRRKTIKPIDISQAASYCGLKFYGSLKK